MNKRISILRKELGLSQEKFAEKIGLSRNFVAQVEIGTKNPSERTIKDICREFNVRYDWLANGNEPMYEETDTSTMARIDYIMTGQDSFAKKMFTEFANLSEEEWKLLEKLIKNLSKS